MRDSTLAELHRSWPWTKRLPDTDVMAGYMRWVNSPKNERFGPNLLRRLIRDVRDARA